MVVALDELLAAAEAMSCFASCMVPLGCVLAKGELRKALQLLRAPRNTCHGWDNCRLHSAPYGQGTPLFQIL